MKFFFNRYHYNNNSKFSEYNKKKFIKNNNNYSSFLKFKNNIINNSNSYYKKKNYSYTINILFINILKNNLISSGDSFWNFSYPKYTLTNNKSQIIYKGRIVHNYLFNLKTLNINLNLLSLIGFIYTNSILIKDKKKIKYKKGNTVLKSFLVSMWGSSVEFFSLTSHLKLLKYLYLYYLYTTYLLVNYYS